MDRPCEKCRFIKLVFARFLLLEFTTFRHLLPGLTYWKVRSFEVIPTPLNPPVCQPRPGRRSFTLLTFYFPLVPLSRRRSGRNIDLIRPLTLTPTSVQRKYISPRTEPSLILPLSKDYKAGRDGEWHNLPRYPLRISRRLLLHQRP